MEGLLDLKIHHETQKLQSKIKCYVVVLMTDHKVGEVKVQVCVDKQAATSLTITYVSSGPLLADVSQVVF